MSSPFPAVTGMLRARTLLIHPLYTFFHRLGNLNHSNVPQVLDAILAHHDGRIDYTHAPPLMPHFWRGRMGVSKDQQLALLDPASGPVEPLLRPLNRRD